MTGPRATAPRADIQIVAAVDQPACECRAINIVGADIDRLAVSTKNCIGAAI
jgi:hypothetical protein